MFHPFLETASTTVILERSRHHTPASSTAILPSIGIGGRWFDLALILSTAVHGRNHAWMSRHCIIVAAFLARIPLLSGPIRRRHHIKSIPISDNHRYRLALPSTSASIAVGDAVLLRAITALVAAIFFPFPADHLCYGHRDTHHCDRHGLICRSLLATTFVPPPVATAISLSFLAVTPNLTRFGLVIFYWTGLV